MSFLDHIDRCNAHNMGRFVPFCVDNATVGHVRHDNIAHLARYPDVFSVAETGIGLAAGLDDYGARTAAVDAVLRDLAARGIVTGWRNEPYPVSTSWAGPRAFQIERAAAPFLGVRAYGVHVNGWVRGDDGPLMWIGRRADDRPVCPGELDNMIAGGQPVGLGLHENVVKEAGEEAGVPPELARRAVAVGAISYVMENEAGLKPDLMFCFDLELPADFVPHNEDGEISEFRLLRAAEVMRIVDETFDFKFNCNLVNIDFFVRHGVLPPEHPDYETILRRLRS